MLLDLPRKRGCIVACGVWLGLIQAGPAKADLSGGLIKDIFGVVDDVKESKASPGPLKGAGAAAAGAKIVLGANEFREGVGSLSTFQNITKHRIPTDQEIDEGAKSTKMLGALGGDAFEQPVNELARRGGYLSAGAAAFSEDAFSRDPARREAAGRRLEQARMMAIQPIEWESREIVKSAVPGKAGEALSLGDRLAPVLLRFIEQHMPSLLEQPHLSARVPEITDQEVAARPISPAAPSDCSDMDWYKSECEKTPPPPVPTPQPTTTLAKHLRLSRVIAGGETTQVDAEAEQCFPTEGMGTLRELSGYDSSTCQTRQEEVTSRSLSKAAFCPSSPGSSSPGSEHVIMIQVDADGGATISNALDGELYQIQEYKPCEPEPVMEVDCSYEGQKAWHEAHSRGSGGPSAANFMCPNPYSFN